jgi:hypothetical protein
MANEEQLKILRQGVKAWNEYRKENPFPQALQRWYEIYPDDIYAENRDAQEPIWIDLSRVDLYGVNLSGSDLSGACFLESKLDDANFNEANLVRANFNGVRLYRANFTKAKLNKAEFRHADLRKASLENAVLQGADLSGAVLHQASLRNADISNTEMDNTIITNVDLSEVKGLDSVHHHGPSTIGIDTFYKSKGKIPVSFLRGAGMPEELITYLPSLVTGKAIEFYSCFISYSSKDDEFAKRLHADLQSRGVRCWYATEDIKGGRKVHEQIPEAIRTHDKLLLVLSEYSMRSEWVKTEIYHARQSEIKEGRRKLFPISLVEFGKVREWDAFDADTGKDMGREVREYFIPDFSGWKEHDKYQEAFERLLRDLNLE